MFRHGLRYTHYTLTTCVHYYTAVYPPSIFLCALTWGKKSSLSFNNGSDLRSFKPFNLLTEIEGGAGGALATEFLSFSFCPLVYVMFMYEQENSSVIHCHAKSRERVQEEREYSLKSGVCVCVFMLTGWQRTIPIMHNGSRVKGGGKGCNLA